MTTLKVKHIRAISKDIERQINEFLSSLSVPTQILHISQEGDFTENGLMSVIISYLN